MDRSPSLNELRQAISPGKSLKKVFAAPASLMITGARNSRPPAIFTPMAFSPSINMFATSAPVITRPPLRSIAGTIAAAIKIMLCNCGVNPKTALPGGKTVVSPLTGEHAYQLLIARQVAEYFCCSTLCPAKKRHAHQSAGNPGHQLRDRLLRIVKPCRSIRRLHGGNVLVDGSGFAWEILLHALPVLLKPTSQVKRPAIDNDPVIDLRHGVPLHYAFGHMIESTPYA